MAQEVFALVRAKIAAFTRTPAYGQRLTALLAEALELKTCDPLRDDALPPPESGSRSREVPTFRQ